MKLVFGIIASLCLTVFVAAPVLDNGVTFDSAMPVSELLAQLGDKPIEHQANTNIKGVSVEVGADLALSGIASKPGGGKTSMQSHHFVCTSCHNIEKEDPNLANPDAQARLEYVSENGMPFLQGSPLYGIVNRSSFYNGDYDKKYGDLVKDARYDIREAIQLCAVECAQGRKLEVWEVESILAWLWTLELKVEDLNLSPAEISAIKTGDKNAAIATIKSKYLDYSPATVLDPPKDRKAGAAVQPNADNGKLVYEASCLHCHENQRYSYYNLDDSKESFRHLKKHFPKYTRYSPYQVIRYGTPPVPGKGAYMPHYTKEKMTDQQLEDLKAYVFMQAE